MSCLSWLVVIPPDFDIIPAITKEDLERDDGTTVEEIADRFEELKREKILWDVGYDTAVMVVLDKVKQFCIMELNSPSDQGCIRTFTDEQVDKINSLYGRCIIKQLELKLAETEKLAWRFRGGEEHGHLSQTWKDAYKELEGEYNSMTDWEDKCIEAEKRYEYVRKLNPRQFTDLWKDCLKNDKRFDEEVNKRMKTRNTTVKFDAEELVKSVEEVRNQVCKKPAKHSREQQ